MNNTITTLRNLLTTITVAVISISIVNAQTTLDGGYSQLLKQKVPVSPQASAIDRFGNYPMDYSTGVPEISIPVFDIRIGDFTLPVTVSYHASGIRVQEIASPVGLGWTLLQRNIIILHLTVIAVEIR